jgi:hypothetical protein
MPDRPVSTGLDALTGAGGTSVLSAAPPTWVRRARSSAAAAG